MEVFVYGTLMVPSIMRAVSGHTGSGEAAVLHGYRRRQIRGEVYPGIVACPGEQVEGLLYRAVSDAALALLDAFEGKMYRRSAVEVITAGVPWSAHAYVVEAGCHDMLTDAPWSFEAFLREGYTRFVGEYRGFVNVARPGDDRDDA